LILLLTILLSSSSFAQIEVIDSLKRVLKITKSDTAKVNTYNTLADKFKESNPDSTSFYAIKASVLAQKVNYNFGLANAFMNAGNSNIILSNYKKALHDFENAKTQYESLLKNPSGIEEKRIKNGLARSYASIGVVFSEINTYSRSLENYFNALKIYQEIGQTNSVSKAYNNIAIVYKSQFNYTKALEYLKKAAIIQEKSGEPTYAVTLTNIGAVYFEQGNNKLANTYFNKAQKCFETTDNKRGCALLNNYIGDYYSKQKDVFQAMNYYENSLRLYDKIENKFGASLVLFRIGELNISQKKYNEALPYLTKSLNYAKEIGVQDQTIQSEKTLSELYGLMNNPTASLVHYKNYIVARDLMENEESDKKFLRSEMNFEYEKREALLVEKNKLQHQLMLFSIIGGLLLLGLIFVTYNRMQVKKRLTLQKEVAEYEQKALHLQMNPHFVFNCLGSISSFIVQNGTDSAIKYLSKFSKLMRLTLEYSKGSLIPVDKEIESLQNYLELEQLRFNNKFEFAIHSSSAIEDDMALPPLLIQPFVENAILHGMVPKEGNGKIEVNFNVINNQLICTIIDDGIGFTKSKEIKENSVKAHQSMALEITKKRLEMMENTSSKKPEVKIEELKDNQGNVLGTKIELNLPIQYLK
jgi:tetratricopeptide (TPR) repeat protein